MFAVIWLKCNCYLMNSITHHPDLLPCHHCGTLIQHNHDDVSVACINDHSFSARVLNAAQGVENYSSVTFVLSGGRFWDLCALCRCNADTFVSSSKPPDIYKL